MNTLAIVFTHERPAVLRHCVDTFFTNTIRLPDRTIFIDDGSGPEVHAVLGDVFARFGRLNRIEVLRKKKPLGFGDSLRAALRLARCYSPRFLFLIESDYVFARGGLEAVWDVLEHSPEGAECYGICGYDHPDFSRADHRTHNYPAEAAQMLGADPVHRPAMWVPRVFAGRSRARAGQFVSNTCISSYLNWQAIAANPAASAALDLAASPRPAEGRPLAAELAAAGCPDDGMMSNGLNHAWAAQATERGINRDRFACWLNILPSVANHISGGGLHTHAPELATDAASPSWAGGV
jgi:hypothetical protein